MRENSATAIWEPDVRGQAQLEATGPLLQTTSAVIGMPLSHCLTTGIAWDHPSHHRVMSLSCDNRRFMSDSALGCTE